MSMKDKVIKRITEVGVVAVVRAEGLEETRKIVSACIEGGVDIIEITFTIPGAHNIIEQIKDEYADEDIIIGAGTVLDAETARIAILSGAEFIVSPCFSKETARLVHRYGLPYLPGAMTIKEIVECLEHGADIVKWFPGELSGPKGIKAIKGPLPHVKLMPTGGVNIENAREWIAAGAIAVGAGGALTGSAKKGDYQTISKKAKQFIDIVHEEKEKAYSS